MQNKLEIIYGQEVAQKITKAKVLVVGAGGIGCELVKIMSMSGFQDLKVIDLDTIDVSNLNRQFLFRRKHVDKPKSETLKQSICEQNPNMTITPFVGKIQEDRFGFKFFKQFDLVINALDNEHARNHVNEMCFNMAIPLVEAGTNGYQATCISIKKGVTQCYQCVAKEKEQSFPVCTIRQKPERVIHCIHWAKFLFDGLFGPKDQASNNMIEDIIEELESAKGTPQYAEIIFARVFTSDPQSLIDNLGDRITKGEQEMDAQEKAETLEFLKKVKPLDVKDFTDGEPFKGSLSLDQEKSLKVLDIQEWGSLFLQTLNKIQLERKSQIGSMVFDKDDSLAMDFVTAATNLRAFNFGISMETLFKIKEMAGKIVPAISSSNALAAALQVSEAIKLLSGKNESLQGVCYNRIDQVGRLKSLKRINEPPNPNCNICSDDSRHIAILELKNLQVLTLQAFIDSVLVEKLGMQKDKGIILLIGEKILCEIDDNLSEDEQEILDKRLGKTLDQLKISSNAIVMAQGEICDSCEVKEDESTSESTIYIQIIENASVEQLWSLQVIKKGIPKKNIELFDKKLNESEKTGALELSEDSCIEFQQHEEVDKNGSNGTNGLLKRKSEPSKEVLELESHAKRQKLE